ncbi:hypothetical protein QKY98_23345, partial [Pseudomonas sp. HR1]|uniref:hypothetical protein n=1 Tax=Pseudomonas sp. HR1 TaxID=1463361 RepID=UPI002542C092
ADSASFLPTKGDGGDQVVFVLPDFLAPDFDLQTVIADGFHYLIWMALEAFSSCISRATRTPVS